MERFELKVSDTGRQVVVYNHYPRFFVMLSNEDLNFKREFQFIDDFKTAIQGNIGVFEPIVDEMKIWLATKNLKF